MLIIIVAVMSLYNKKQQMKETSLILILIQMGLLC